MAILKKISTCGMVGILGQETLFIVKTLTSHRGHNTPRAVPIATDNTITEKRCSVFQWSILCVNHPNEPGTSDMWSRTASGYQEALDHIPMATHYKQFVQ